MSFPEAIKTCLRKYFTLSGRASRSEYWWFVLFLVLVGVASAVIDSLAFGFSENAGPVETITNFALLAPQITASVRRLHDTGRPGYYLFFPLLTVGLGLGLGALFGTNFGSASGLIVVLVMASGFLVSLYWLIQKSEPIENKYGPGPHYDTTVFE